MGDHKPVSRVYSNVVSAKAHAGLRSVHCGDHGADAATQDWAADTCTGNAALSADEAWLRLPSHDLDLPPGCNVFDAHQDFDLGYFDDVSYNIASSCGPLADAELLSVTSEPMSPGMLEPVVFMPPVVDLVNRPCAAGTAAKVHMSNADAWDEGVRREVLAHPSCPCCVGKEASPEGCRSRLGHLSTLQEVTLEYMEANGLLDFTLEVHMRTLGILKWSSRKRGAIRRLLRHSPDLQGRSGNTVDAFDQTVGEIRGALEQEYSNYKTPTPIMKTLIRDLRQRWYKTREYRLHRHGLPSGTSTPKQATPPRARA
ncbi:hypothetical protein CVIRNUC_008699 [Coccomyxa viridis]|uniref:Uncharacterized protein n=1 Tax=Coccomyxa viridis TaxID=1274662 RepID=A0AAV1IGZ8_9CHLO|nr:hypothetical protein CVIRNUC_008699 [Coccomyxa viridis]